MSKNYEFISSHLTGPLKIICINYQANAPENPMNTNYLNRDSSILGYPGFQYILARKG